MQRLSFDKFVSFEVLTWQILVEMNCQHLFSWCTNSLLADDCSGWRVFIFSVHTDILCQKWPLKTFVLTDLSWNEALTPLWRVSCKPDVLVHIRTFALFFRWDFFPTAPPLLPVPSFAQISWRHLACLSTEHNCCLADYCIGSSLLHNCNLCLRIVRVR